MNTCNGDWRCRRICKMGRASNRKRPPHCQMRSYGKPSHRLKTAQPKNVAATQSCNDDFIARDAPTLLAAE